MKMKTASAAARIRRTEGVALKRRMVLLSLPSFIGLAGVIISIFVGLLLKSLSYEGGDFPPAVQAIGLPFVLVWFFAMFAQVFTLPLAAITLFKVLRLGPSRDRASSASLFFICLGGFLSYVVFAVFF